MRKNDFSGNSTYDFKNLFVLFFSTISVYFNSLFNPFVWDDLSLISENFLIRNFKFLLSFFKTDIFLSNSNFYRPIQMFFYTLVYKLSGQNPVGYHLLNIFFHSGCSILIYLLLKKIYQDKISFLVSLLWAIHPINSESITYISGTADPLFLFFGLL
ncbi:MAG: hypothetical protein ACK4F0_05485, partial [Candidatus Ratteibacteria bacterium]